MFNYYIRKIFVSLCSIAGMFILFALLVWAVPVSESVKNGIDICLHTLIPSLFVFMCISSFFMKTDLLRFILYPFSLLCSKLFKTDVSLGPLLFMSLVGGYPIGAKLISELVTQGKLKRKDADRLLCFCVNAGPAFLIGAVALPIFRSQTLGLVLFVCNLISFFIIGILTGIGKEPIKAAAEEKKKDFSFSLVDSVYSSIKAMGLVCGFVLIFSVIIGLLEYSGAMEVIAALPSVVLGTHGGTAFITGILEVVNGIQACGKVSGAGGFVLAAGITAFGGLSVHSQIKAIIITGKISMKPFYCWRVVSVAVSCLCAYLYIIIVNPTISTFFDYNGNKGEFFSFTPLSSIFLIVLAIMLLFNIKKSAKIDK